MLHHAAITTPWLQCTFWWLSSGKALTETAEVKKWHFVFAQLREKWSCIRRREVTEMLSVMIYPSWHWELLWQLAQPELVVSLSLPVSAWCLRLIVFSREDSSFFCFLTYQHILLLVHLLGCELHTVPPPMCASHPFCWRIKLQMYRGNLSFTSPPPPFSSTSSSSSPSPRCHTVSPLLHKLCLNPLPGRTERQLHAFQARDLNSCGRRYGPISLGHFFSLQQWKLKPTSLS